MNNPQTLPPPPRPGAGCLGIGCMSFLAFFLFLIVAFVAGGFWALHHVRRTYSSDEPMPIPQVAPSTTETTSSAPSAPVVVAPQSTPPQLESGTPSAEPTVPATPTAPTLTGPVQQRWKAFQRAARRGEKARIEMTADEINTLIADDKNARGKAFVRIENNVGRVSVSIPLDEVVFMSGRYLNGEATVRASPDGDPAKAEISEVTIGSESVSDNFLDRRIFGWSSLRGYIGECLAEENIGTFRIENNRAIGETR